MRKALSESALRLDARGDFRAFRALFRGFRGPNVLGPKVTPPDGRGLTSRRWFPYAMHNRLTNKGFRQGEDVYCASGQADSGRYLIFDRFFIWKADNLALVISARDMDPRERTAYERK